MHDSAKEVGVEVLTAECSEIRRSFPFHVVHFLSPSEVSCGGNIKFCSCLLCEICSHHPPVCTLYSLGGSTNRKFT